MLTGDMRSDWLPNVRPGPVMSHGAMEAGMTDESLAGASAGLTPNCVRLSTSAQWSAAAPDQNLPPVSGPKIFVGIYH